MSAKKKPFQFQYTVLFIENIKWLFRVSRTRSQSDIVPESL